MPKILKHPKVKNNESQQVQPFLTFKRKEKATKIKVVHKDARDTGNANLKIQASNSSNDPSIPKNHAAKKKIYLESFTRFLK